MSKTYKFNKYLYAFIFSVISILVFIVEFKTYNSIYTTSNSSFVNFLTELFNSFKKFDIIYVTLWIFILYFYLNVYFDGKKYDKKSVVCTVIAVIFTVLTIIAKSYGIDNTLETIYESSTQIFKTVIFAFGYYLIYYAISKKLFNIKLDANLVKKKPL